MSELSICSSRRVMRLCQSLAVLLCLGQTTALGQTFAAPDEVGLQPNRDYVQLLPFERIDTASGNVLLSFTDLALPGNNGRTLSFERAFNNRVNSTSDLQWRFGISGVPMSVVEKARPPRNQPIVQTITGERQWAPYFPLIDGSTMETTFVQTPDSRKDATQQWVQSSAFWRYDRELRNLHLPDGTVAHYTGSGAETGLLDSITDAFGNRVTLTRSTGHLQVVQSLGPDAGAPFRTIEIEMDDATGLPTELTFGARTWTYVYDTVVSGRLLEVQPPAGQPWSFEYDVSPSGKLLRLTTPEGGTVAYTYEDQSFVDAPSSSKLVNVLRTRTAGGRGVNSGTWNFTFSVGPLDIGLTNVDYPLSGSTSFAYEFRGEVLAGAWAMADRSVTQAGSSVPAEVEHRDYSLVPAGRASNSYAIPEITLRRYTRAGRDYTTTYAYGASNFGDFHRPNLITETGAAGELSRTTQLEYVHAAVPTSTRHLLGLQSRELVTVAGQTVEKTWTHNLANGFRTAQTIYGIGTTFTPDALGNVRTLTKANGKTVTYDYAFGQVSQSSSPGVVVSRTILVDGTASSETIAGRTTQFDHDALFRLSRIQPPGGSNPTIISYSNVEIRTTQGPSSTLAELDGFGRVVTTTDTVGRRTRQEFDAEGRRVYQSLVFVGSLFGPNDRGTTYQYDVLGRITSETNADSSSRIYSYVGNITSMEDEEGRTTQFQRKAFGDPDDTRLTGLVDAGGKSWSYAYNAIGLITSVAGSGASRSWTYTTARPTLLTGETHPESGSTSYTYDAAGVLKTKVDAKGTTFSYVHDGSDRVVRETAGTEITTFTYEAGSSNPVMRRGPSGTSVLAYDDAGRLSNRSDIDFTALSVGVDYDGNGNVTQISYPSGRRVGYEYDSENRVTRVFNAYTQEDYATSFSYHPSGGIAQYTTSNGLTTTIDYDPNRYWVNRIRVGDLDLTYQYDDVGNVSAVLDARPNKDQSFTYDDLDRLIGVAGQDYPSMSFAYDSHGNRVSTPGSVYNYAPGFRLIGFNGLSMTYDSNGNLLTGPQATFDYTPKNLLRSSTVAGVTATYAYDADDWRIKKTVAGEAPTFYVRGPDRQLLTEWSNTTPLARVRDYIYAGSRLLAAVTVDLPSR